MQQLDGFRNPDDLIGDDSVEIVVEASRADRAAQLDHDLVHRLRGRRPEQHGALGRLARADGVHELTIPSGYQTGVKLVHKFEIVPDRTVDLILDFDACASVVKAGKNGKYLLKPTIKITDAVNNAIVNGIVLGAQQMGLEDDAVGLEGATVSAQTHKETSDAKDQVSVYVSSQFRKVPCVECIL